MAFSKFFHLTKPPFRSFSKSKIFTMPTARATLPSGTVLAETTTYETVEGNIYFPPSSIKDKSLFTDSNTHTTCPWKGKSSYYNVKADGNEVKDVAWYYPSPKEAAKNIEGYLAFCEYWC
jgi:uncharacterized protein (DUF427 family)